MQLRYYQREAIEAMNSGFYEYQSGLLSLGTGAGKTAIIASDIKNQKGRCLFLSDQRELIQQPIRALQKVAGIIAAIDQGRLKAPPSARVVVGSAQTLCKKPRLERFRPDHFQRIYVDEAHRGSDRNREICNYFGGAQVCGLTATPFRANLADLSDYYDTVFYSKPMLNLCEEGFAPPMRVFHLPIEIDLEAVKTKMTPDGKEYSAEELDSTIAPHMRAIAAAVAEHARGRHIIAYLPLVKTSIEFAKALRNAGVTAQHVDGGSPDRDQILAGFEHGRFSCLCNAGVVSTGVDLPIADCYLPLRPMKSASLYQQSAGRTLRPQPGLIDHLPEYEQAAERRLLIEWSDKPDALMFDLLWQHDKLGVMNPACLVANNAEEAGAMMAAARKKLSPEDLLALQKRVQAEKEAQMVRALERAQAKAELGKPLPFAQAAYLTNNRRLLTYVPVARWELQPPSDAQKGALSRLGIDPATIETKGCASKLLDELTFRIRHRFATLKQLKLIHAINDKRAPEARVAQPDRLTVAEANAIIDADMAARSAARLVAA